MAVSEWLPHRCGWSGSSVAFDYHNFSPPPRGNTSGRGSGWCVHERNYFVPTGMPQLTIVSFSGNGAMEPKPSMSPFAPLSMCPQRHLPKIVVFFLPCFNFRFRTPSYGSRNDPPFAPPLGPCGPGPPGGTAPLRRRALRGGPPPVGRRLLRPPRARRRPPPAQATGTPRTASHFKGRRVGEGVTGS